MKNFLEELPYFFAFLALMFPIIYVLTRFT